MNKFFLYLLFLFQLVPIFLQGETFHVTTLGDPSGPPTGSLSLREAITRANENSDIRNEIEFDVKGTIQLLSDLPEITKPITIDGFQGSQRGKPNTASIHEANNAIINIEIRGPGPGLNIEGPLYGLVLGNKSDGSIIRGLAISDFAKITGTDTGITATGAGILIKSTRNAVEGCFIGTDRNGTESRPCFTAISNFGNYNTIGGDMPAQENLLSGQYGGTGILQDQGSFTVIQGNKVGLDRTGTVVLMPAQRIGVVTSSNEGSSILNNIISGCKGANLIISQTNNVVAKGNYVGTNAAGTQSSGFNGIGIIAYDPVLNAPINILIEDNVISGNEYGIHVGENTFSMYPCNGVQIKNNRIGVDNLAENPIPNEFDGIWLKFSQNTYIANNTICANGRHGIRTGKNVGANIKGNTIGKAGLGNAGDGIRLGTTGNGWQSANDIIGGAKPGEGNVIEFNGGDGIGTFSYVQNETIIGNTIRGNGKNGIYLGRFSRDNFLGIYPTVGRYEIIGGLEGQGNTNLGPLGTSNLIAQNGENGILLVESDHNVIQTNIIDGNEGYGIKLECSNENLIGGPENKSSVYPPVLANEIINNGKGEIKDCGCDNKILININ